MLLYIPYAGWPLVMQVEMQTATSSAASWFLLQVQHLKITMVTGFLPMGNGNTYDQLSCILVPAACASPGIMINMLG